jgi:signal transduction histidine kinase
VRVTPRITIASGLIVAVVLGAWGYFDHRAKQRNRSQAVEREARAIASAVRVTLESGRSWLDHPRETSRELSRALAPWTVTVAKLDLGDLELTPAQRHRLQAFAEAPKFSVATYEDRSYVVALPIRRPAPTIPDGTSVIGMVEVSRSVAFLDAAARDDLAQAGLLVILVVGLTTLAVGYLAVTLMSRPVAKLLRGVDEVARGDLSHALLSERDDEIGTLANRFNEMTYNLRESRAEGQRQNQAKLELEQRLAQTEKLATIGQLAAEIAHEVGTPLGVIGGRARAIHKKSSDPEVVEKNAAIIAEQTTRITKIIQRLLDFARRKVGQTERVGVNLNELSLTTMELLGGQFTTARIRTTLARAEALPRVAGDPDRLQQVLLNLLLNAMQAMPRGGTLRVETGTDIRQRPGLELAPQQRFVQVEVTDSGVGIPAELRDKIFEPFFTTKETRGGTGLGLAVCSGIVKEHDGWIEIDDAPRGGTTFRVFLPALE